MDKNSLNSDLNGYCLGQAISVLLKYILWTTILSIHKYHYSHCVPSFPEVFTIVDPFIRCTTKDIRKRYSRKDSVFVTLPLPRSARTVGRRLIIFYNKSVRLGAHEVRPAPSTFTQMFARETNWYELDKFNSIKPPPWKERGFPIRWNIYLTFKKV